MCKHDELIHTLVHASRELKNPIHTKSLEVLCHLTRFADNCLNLTKNRDLLDAIVFCGGESLIVEDRVWLMRMVQNLSTSSQNETGENKLNLALQPNMLSVISTCAMSKDQDEKLAASGALLNISTEPRAVVPLINTRNVVATLVSLAHSKHSSEEVRLYACETLATLSLWLQNLASKGMIPKEVENNFLPSHMSHSWKRFD